MAANGEQNLRIIGNPSGWCKRVSLFQFASGYAFVLGTYLLLGRPQW